MTVPSFHFGSVKRLVDPGGPLSFFGEEQFPGTTWTIFRLEIERLAGFHENGNRSMATPSVR